MRFERQHLVGTVTVFAILLAFATATGHTNRDGIWELVSIETVQVWTGEGLVPGDKVGHLRDGHRNARVLFGNHWDLRPHELPRPGVLVELQGTRFRAQGSGHKDQGTRILDGDAIRRRFWSISEQTPWLPRVLFFARLFAASLALVVLSVAIRNLIVHFAALKRNHLTTPASPRDRLAVFDPQTDRINSHYCTTPPHVGIHCN